MAKKRREKKRERRDSPRQKSGGSSGYILVQWWQHAMQCAAEVPVPSVHDVSCAALRKTAAHEGFVRTLKA